MRNASLQAGCIVYSSNTWINSSGRFGQANVVGPSGLFLGDTVPSPFDIATVLNFTFKFFVAFSDTKQGFFPENPAKSNNVRVLFMLRRRLISMPSKILTFYILAAFFGPALSIIVSKQNVDISEQHGYSKLASFGFHADGRVAASFQHVHPTLRQTQLDPAELGNITFYIIVYDNWIKFLRLASMSKGDLCTIANASLISESNSTMSSFLNASSPTIFTVKTTATYIMALFNCITPPTAFQASFDLSMQNKLANGSYSHLGVGFLYLPWVYITIAFGLWPIVWIIWYYNWWKYRAVFVFIGNLTRRYLWFFRNIQFFCIACCCLRLRLTLHELYSSGLAITFFL